jgi:hypothetical protein
LLDAIDGFFTLIAKVPATPEAIQLAFTIHRCEYAGRPADVKTLTGLMKWSKSKVIFYLRELQENFGYRTVTDEFDAGHRGQERRFQRGNNTERPEERKSSLTSRCGS